MSNSIKIRTLLQIEKRKWLFLMGLVALTHLFCQSLMLPYGNALLSLLPDTKDSRVTVKGSEHFVVSSVETVIVDNPREVVASNLNNESIRVRGVRSASSYNGRGGVDDHERSVKKDIDMKLSLDGDDMESDFDFSEEETLDSRVTVKGSDSVVSSVETVIVDNPREVAASNWNNEFIRARGVRSASSYNGQGGVDDHERLVKKDIDMKSSLDGDDMDRGFDFFEDETLDSINMNMADGPMMQNDRSQDKGSLLETEASESSLARDHLAKGSSGIDVLYINPIKTQEETVTSGSAAVLLSLIKSSLQNVSESDVITSAGSDFDLSSEKIKETPDSEGHLLLGSNYTASSSGSLMTKKPVKKKMRCEMPPKTVLPINDMQQLLVRHRARSRAMRPRWSSERDREIMAAKLKIQQTPVLKIDRDLYAPLFRNVSMFQRSYELMERVLKIYVYKEGEKPIFHQPILKGLYASEGWFMKLMEGNKQFVVKDPRKAHLFYMPFSSRMLEYTLYVRNSHNRTNLRQYLKDYSEKIAAKYRFWNRTGGADHFLVACHDWAPYETRHHMEHCIKALCNADVTMGFKIGRDVSFPETYVRSARNPLRDLGGKPPSQRNILAFYAGGMHGYLRPILLNYWQDKDPDMKILGRLPLGVASKMNYIQHMKSSKYCICPKGYEVNSPRIVEAIFYECVPVIISDNFVPPFFEVLNWEAFSVIVAEKDIPNLKNILVSIPEHKYLEMQMGVRKVQQHFLWHAKPVKYDLFHMTLHSIWYNRVFQIKPR